MDAAGSLVRAARQRAGLSQAELGRRAGITQSVISAYESGARQPSMPTLTRIIEATGAALDVRLQYSADTQPREGALARRVRDHRDEILAVLRKCGLTNPRLFGSVVRGEETPASDVDLLVDVAAGVGLFALARCQAELEALLGVPVDLVPAADLKPGVAGHALADAVAL
jgi:predicted nucleotidyltransferase/DNA-binding XRE family transcriptional regulator